MRATFSTIHEDTRSFVKNYRNKKKYERILMLSLCDQVQIASFNKEYDLVESLLNEMRIIHKRKMEN